MKTTFSSFARAAAAAAAAAAALIASASASAPAFAQSIPDGPGWDYYADCHSDSYFGGWNIKVYTDNGSGNISASLERVKGPDGDGVAVSYAIVKGHILGYQSRPRTVQFELDSTPKSFISISIDRALDGLHVGAIDMISADGSKDSEQLLCSIH